jgi:hypothetical protein
MNAELMVAVERAVRPVRAGGARKYRMRQELLAHLTASYEEERAKLGDDRAAVEAAVRRLGDPTEITKEMQATVPLVEQFLYLPLVPPRWLRPWEMKVRAWAERFAHPAFFAALWAVFSVAILYPLARQRYLADPADLDEYRLVHGGVAAAAVASFAFMWCLSRMCQAVAGVPGVRRGLVYGAVAVVLLIASSPLQVRLLLGPDEVTTDRLVRAAVASVVFVAGLAGVARFMARFQARTRDWARLEIGG